MTTIKRFSRGQRCGLDLTACVGLSTAAGWAVGTDLDWLQVNIVIADDQTGRGTVCQLHAPLTLTVALKTERKA